MEFQRALPQTRSYQQEMFERSMQRNTIVVMDTGSGKTHVAMLRIQAELDRCHPDKRVWFLAPTVELCIQQHKELSAALPAYNHRLLTGSDNVDRWSEERIWEAALYQHQVVVSTHAVLADALRHGFVRLSSVALLVFDEAHHCVKKHPANAIMKDFYHPRKNDYGSSSVPHILGLSASLITRSHLNSMQYVRKSGALEKHELIIQTRMIEKNLDSIGVTPRIHREDLLRYVHRPECQLLVFDASGVESSSVVPAGMQELDRLRSRLSLSHLMQQVSLQSDTALTDIATSGVSREQQATATTIQAFCRKAGKILEDLGPWAADQYVSQTIRALEKSNDSLRDLFNGQGSTRRKLVTLLAEVRKQVESHENVDPGDQAISPKVKRLIAFLIDKNHNDPVGIVFVEQRATTSILAELLQRHPTTKGKFKCVPFVGTSSASSRTYGLTELVDLKAQKDTLSRFRKGDHNLIIATNALEEGIDVQSCNIIACFDPPANVKSFIQRRGRARHIRSSLAIMVSSVADRGIINRWQLMEAELSQACQRDRTLASLASVTENRDERPDYKIVVPSTGAKLTADDTLPHLHHFCNKLPHRPYVDFSPQFFYEEDSSGLVEATVTLPNCLSVQLRHASSQKRWRTERAAKKDAAFQAYSALREAGLLNENLLPLCHEWEADRIEDFNESQVGLIEISPQLDIWHNMELQKADVKWHETAITVTSPDVLRANGESDVKLLLMTPGRLDPVPMLSLNWNSECTFIVKFGRCVPVTKPSTGDLKLLRRATELFYTSVRSERLAGSSDDFLTFLTPHLKSISLARWLQTNSGSKRASDIVGTSPTSLVRVPYPNNPPHVFRKWEDSEEGITILCEKLPRRRNFRIPAPSKEQQRVLNSPSLCKESALEAFAADSCTFDSLPFNMARIGLFMPDILQHIADCAISKQTRSAILDHVPFVKNEHLMTALFAPSAQRQTNYQRFEFVGDSILKFVVSCHLFVSQPDWYEGLLTRKRSQLVCNTNLTRAAIGRGLAPYIITESISYKDWTIPVYSPAHQTQKHRLVSCKTPADVVEALVGAAWVDSGMSAARKCINVFLPTIPSSPANFNIVAISEQIEFAIADKLEILIQYKFTNRALLLEAMTHPSCGGHARTDSYQRLEYLGDAVLDMLIAQRMAENLDVLSQGRMTQIKGALVNARLLGFLCLHLRQLEAHSAPETDLLGNIRLSSSTREVHLDTFMRFDSKDLAAARQACQERYYTYQNDIRRQLDIGKQYPWEELLQLRPDKFYSDLIESVLGAIFVDARGSLIPCLAFIKVLGLQEYIDRIIHQDVDVSHPRDRVQRWAGAKSVSYTVQRNETDGLFECSLLLDTVEVTKVDGCCDREEAMTRVTSEVETMLRSGEIVWK